jgi:hypothetical protein
MDLYKPRLGGPCCPVNLGTKTFFNFLNQWRQISLNLAMTFAILLELCAGAGSYSFLAAGGKTLLSASSYTFLGLSDAVT